MELSELLVAEAAGALRGRKAGAMQDLVGIGIPDPGEAGRFGQRTLDGAASNPRAGPRKPPGWNRGFPVRPDRAPEAALLPGRPGWKPASWDSSRRAGGVRLPPDQTRKSTRKSRPRDSRGARGAPVSQHRNPPSSGTVPPPPGGRRRKGPPRTPSRVACRSAARRWRGVRSVLRVAVRPKPGGVATRSGNGRDARPRFAPRPRSGTTRRRDIRARIAFRGR